MSAIASSPTRLNPRHVPLATVGATEHKQRLALREWVPCPQCGKMFVAAQVVSDDPKFVYCFMTVCYTGWVVRRRMFVDCCNQIIRWHQASDRSGGKLGAEIGTFDIVTDQNEINAFLRAHPQAAGVEM